MARIAFRFATATVGLVLLAGYLAAALLVFEALRALWALRPGTAELVVLLAAATLGSAYLSYRFGTARLLAALEADPIPRAHAPELHRRLDALVARMDVDRPTLYVSDARAPNAFAVGGSGGGSLVIDRSLFRLLSPPELEGILAHELAHLETNDGLVAALVDGLARTVVGVVTLATLPALLALSGLAGGSAWIRGRPGDRSGVFARLHRLLAGGVVAAFVLATLLARTRSRRREFAADDRAAAVTGDPLALARALRRIDRASDPSWPFAPFSSHRDTGDPLERWLSTHPPTAERVERLRRRAEAGSARRGREGWTGVPVR
ncbi:heat shock protein HtpX [Halorubrum aquaticum]|uniref:Heat shock protein HtpX n=1 Tax=Halorubrum aquaticum TaxID=387340 RepID=A0A1I3AEB6_9EURY|nr:M48 family metalloprotease [Halorubrum aquaticum]SFH48280.1 heat shock protein HtpX [Halorubrum aquaticum]